MLAITLLGSLIFFQKRKKIIWFLCICFLTGLGYYFMPSIVLYPFFLVVFLVILRRIPWKVGVSFLLIAAVIVGLLVYPHNSFVQEHKDNLQIPKPYFWYWVLAGHQNQCLLFDSRGAVWKLFWRENRSHRLDSGFMDYARAYPMRILGMTLGTLSISLLFPLALIAVVLLVREKKWASALFFFHIPCYFLLLQMCQDICLLLAIYCLNSVLPHHALHPSV